MRHSRDFSRTIRFSFQGPRETFVSVSEARYLVSVVVVVNDFGELFFRVSCLDGVHLFGEPLWAPRRCRRGGGYMDPFDFLSKNFFKICQKPRQNRGEFLCHDRFGIGAAPWPRSKMCWPNAHLRGRRSAKWTVGRRSKEHLDLRFAENNSFSTGCTGAGASIFSIAHTSPG